MTATASRARSSRLPVAVVPAVGAISAVFTAIPILLLGIEIIGLGAGTGFAILSEPRSLALGRSGSPGIQGVTAVVSTFSALPIIRRRPGSPTGRVPS